MLVAAAFWQTVSVWGEALVKVGAVLGVANVKLPGNVTGELATPVVIQFLGSLIAVFAAVIEANEVAPLYFPLVASVDPVVKLLKVYWLERSDGKYPAQTELEPADKKVTAEEAFVP
jgi:hypothetical protein